MFFIAYAFTGQVHVFAGRVKTVSHLTYRTSAILKHFCSVIGSYLNVLGKPMIFFHVFWKIYNFKHIKNNFCQKKIQVYLPYLKFSDQKPVA